MSVHNNNARLQLLLTKVRGAERSFQVPELPPLGNIDPALPRPRSQSRSTTFTLLQDCDTVAILTKILASNGYALAGHDPEAEASDHVAACEESGAAYYRYVHSMSGYATTCKGGPFRAGWKVIVAPLRR